ncbi:MAG: hypothetical protein NC121_18445 [Blautia sp.]|nr:hypothetical protein [Blautia sp.]
MKNELDELLTRVLTPREEPGDILNRRILNQVKEGESMKSKKYKRASAAVIAAAVVAASSITAVAAWQYRSASQVAEEFGDESLAGHFAEQASQGAVMDPPVGQAGSAEADKGISETVGESQSFGGYKVTLLGLLSGENLSEYQSRVNGNVRNDSTYCVVAIEREDGAAVDAENDNFFVSPLIGGLEPWRYNAASMGGNYSEFVENGVLYRLSECDNIAYFADHELYLCVTDTSFYDTRLYHYDEAAGSISRNADYEGLNALFELKLDTSLADPARAQALIDAVNAPDGDDGTGVEIPPEAAEAMAWAGNLTSENLEQYCVRMENTVQTVFPDRDGIYVIESWLVNEAVSDTAGGSATFPAELYNAENYTLGTLYIGGYGGSSMADLVIDTFILNEDGSLTFAAWVPREVSMYLK